MVQTRQFFFFLLLSITISSLQAQVVSTFVASLGNDRLEAITMNHNGYLYAPGFQDGRIYKIDGQGNWNFIISGISGPLGGAVDADSNFYFSEYNTGKIYKVRPDDSYNEFASGFSGPTGMVMGPQGDTLYVANYNNDAIYKVALADSSVHTWISGNGINGPDGLVFDPDDNLYIANFDDNRVHKATPSGQVSQFSTLTGSSNSGYICLVDSTFYITAFNSHKVYALDMAGNAVVVAGTGFPGFANGPALQARFFRPNGIASNPAGDSLFITDGAAQGKLRVLALNAVAIGLEAPLASTQARILGASPNPVATATQLRYALPAPGQVKLSVHDAQGRLVALLCDEMQAAGEHNFQWNPSPKLAAGSYQLVLETNSKQDSFKLLLVR